MLGGIRVRGQAGYAGKEKSMRISPEPLYPLRNWRELWQSEPVPFEHGFRDRTDSSRQPFYKLPRRYSTSIGSIIFSTAICDGSKLPPNGAPGAGSFPGATDRAIPWRASCFRLPVQPSAVVPESPLLS